MKKHFLLVWPTIRKDWLSVFLDLREDFRFTFLAGTFPQETNYAKEFDCVYWSDFQSAQDVLERLKPDGLVFMSIDSGLSMVLNHAAKKRGLKTHILQHGIYTNYRDYRNREKLWRKKERIEVTREAQNQRGFSSLRFAKNSLNGLDKVWLFGIAAYTYMVKKNGPYWASRHLPLSIKKADSYLCFSPFNAIIHKETDRISDQKIRYIGSQELIGYLKIEEREISESYFLHMDQALAENSFGEETVKKEEMIAFYHQLNSFCKSQSAKLYIKLHPESYESKWLPQDENIVYLKHVENLNLYVQNAKGCFGFYSTMVIPAIYWKPTVLFRIQYSGLQEAIEEIKAAKCLDFWSFRSEDISFESGRDMKVIIKEKFILPHGVSDGSLKRILNED